MFVRNIPSCILLHPFGIFWVVQGAKTGVVHVPDQLHILITVLQNMADLKTSYGPVYASNIASVGGCFWLVLWLQLLPHAAQGI